MTEREVSSERVSGERLLEIIEWAKRYGEDARESCNVHEMWDMASELLALRSSVKTVGDAAFEAVLNCPHVIEGARVVLKADYEKPGNALAQLHARLSALEAPTPQEAPSEVTDQALRDADTVSLMLSQGKRIPRVMTEDLRNHVRKLAAALKGDRP
jgi:hypothetical protein